MSYLQFHLLFILPPIVLLALILPRPLSAIGRRAGLGIPLIALVALIYTTPWDNYLIRAGVWGYDEDLIVGTIGYVPLEEYLFFLLQPLLTGLWLYRLLARNGAGREGPARKRRLTIRVAGVAAWVSLGIAGTLLLGWEPGFYLGLILVWATPILAVQWAYGGGFFWSVRGTLLLGVAVPTAYLWLVDRLALGFGIWSLSDDYTTGLEPLGLPVEEAIFFLMTNLLVVQGLLAFLLWTSKGTRKHPANDANELPDSPAARLAPPAREQDASGGAASR